MSLYDVIADLNDIFFDAENFAEEVTYQPGGSTEYQFTINAIVDWGGEEGTNQNRGEGRSGLNAERGRSTRSTPVVELPTTRVNSNGITVPVVASESGNDRILVLHHGNTGQVRLVVDRVIARDASAQSILCHFETQHQTQPRKTRFG